MPLRDHFRPPLDDIISWEGFYGGWPPMIVLGLSRQLPPKYAPAPRIHLGTYVESLGNIDLPDQYEYEVRVYDTRVGRRLVAVVEFVCPANKDRPQHRRLFVAKCAARLREGVSVAIIDPVTTWQFNLYRELLGMIGQSDRSLAPEPPSLYAAACRVMPRDDAWRFEAWNYPLALGQPLPTIPLWLADNIALPLDLEASYEETCGILRIA